MNYNELTVISEETIASDRIYLRENSDFLDFHVLSQNDNKYFMTKIGSLGSYSYDITLNELEAYISLEEALDKATYQGYYATYLNTIPLIVLYELRVHDESFSIIMNLEQGRFMIQKSNLCLQPVKPYEGDEYKDKEYLKKMIEKQIRDILISGDLQEKRGR